MLEFASSEVGARSADEEAVAVVGGLCAWFLPPVVLHLPGRIDAHDRGGFRHRPTGCPVLVLVLVHEVLVRFGLAVSATAAVVGQASAGAAASLR